MVGLCLKLIFIPLQQSNFACKNVNIEIVKRYKIFLFTIDYFAANIE